MGCSDICTSRKINCCSRDAGWFSGYGGGKCWRLSRECVYYVFINKTKWKVTSKCFLRTCRGHQQVFQSLPCHSSIHSHQSEWGARFEAWCTQFGTWAPIGISCCVRLALGRDKEPSIHTATNQQLSPSFCFDFAAILRVIQWMIIHRRRNK